MVGGPPCRKSNSQFEYSTDQSYRFSKCFTGLNLTTVTNLRDQKIHKSIVVSNEWSLPCSIAMIGHRNKWIIYKQTFVPNLILVVTLPKKGKSPLKISLPKRKFIFQPSIFRCKLLVSGRVILTSIMGYSDSCRELVTIVYSWLVNLPPYKVPREK